MSPLNPWQKNVLKTTRNNWRERGVLLYVLTGSGIQSDDAYRIQTAWTRSLLRTFSGAVAWTPREQRSESEGGFLQTATARIAADRVEKTHLDRKDTIVQVDGIDLRIIQLTDVPETDEVVIDVAQIE